MSVTEVLQVLCESQLGLTARQPLLGNAGAPRWTRSLGPDDVYRIRGSGTCEAGVALTVTAVSESCFQTYSRSWWYPGGGSSLQPKSK